MNESLKLSGGVDSRSDSSFMSKSWEKAGLNPLYQTFPPAWLRDPHPVCVATASPGSGSLQGQISQAMRKRTDRLLRPA